MKYSILVIFCSALSIWPIELNNLARFQKFLKEFKDPDYSESDKDIYGNFWYDASLDKQFPDQPDITENADETEMFHKTLVGSLGFRGTWIKSSDTFQLDQHMDINGSINEMESSNIKSNTLSGMHDTNAIKERIFAGRSIYTMNFERHFGFERLKGLPFWELPANVDLAGLDRVRKDYDSKSTITTSEKSIFRNATNSVRLMPGIGFGRRKPVLPVYRAFEFERTLKRRGLIDHNLSDSTMTALIGLNASIQAYNLKNELWQKYFMQQLENIILTDDAIRDSSLNALTLFTLYETILTPLPDFYHGFKMSINGNLIGTTHYLLQKYYEDEVSRSSEFGFDLNYGAFGTISMTYQVFSRLFFECSLLKSTLIDESDERYPEYSDSYKDESLLELTPDNHYDFMLKGTFHYFITNRILMNCGLAFKNSTSRYKRQLAAGFLNLTIYIEDDISLNCSIRRLITENKSNDDYNRINYKRKYDNISVGLIYDL
jgi:hypothetical protein